MNNILCKQWLPESARYDVLTGNQEKALSTLKRIAAENKVPMPLGKLIVARQVKSWLQTSSSVVVYLVKKIVNTISTFLDAGGQGEVSGSFLSTLPLDHCSAMVHMVR